MHPLAFYLLHTPCSTNEYSRDRFHFPCTVTWWENSIYGTF